MLFDSVLVRHNVSLVILGKGFSKTALVKGFKIMS